MEHNARRQIFVAPCDKVGEIHNLAVRHQDLGGGTDFTTTPRDCFAAANFGMLQGMWPLPPAPTLEQLRRDCPWCWVVCERCLHRKPVAFTPLIIRWGPDAPSDLMRRSAHCEKCGAKGAALQHPSWGGEQFQTS